MATKFLRQIILEELKKVLREGIGGYDFSEPQKELSPETAAAMKSSAGGIPASDLTKTGVEAHVAGAAETTPIGKLQARLAKKGFIVSRIGDGKQPDGRIGELTLKALEKVTGKKFTAQQLRRMTENPSAMNDLMTRVLDRKSVV